MRQYMLDIETLGTRPGSVVAAIGICELDFATRSIARELEVKLDLHSALAHGATVDAGTLYWWFQQSREAIEDTLFRPSVPYEEGLLQFCEWLYAPADEKGDFLVWAKGTTFDIPLMEAALRQCKMSPPWKYWSARDYRTLLATAKSLGINTYPLIVEPTVAHSALEDTRAQALSLFNLLDAIGPKAAKGAKRA